MKIDISEEDADLLGGLLNFRWHEADKARMETRPDSSEERYWLEVQRRIEIMQSKLFVTPDKPK